MQAKRILLLGAHTDDGEWGCGGSIHKWMLRGAEVTYVAFSAAEESVRGEFPRDVLRREIFLGSAQLGIAPQQVRVLDFPVRKFPQYRQEILEALVKLRGELQPDLVLVHSSEDTHQDHETLNRETFRAFKRTSILGYEVPHNHRSFGPSYFCELLQTDLDAKVRALESYESQRWRLDDTKGMLVSLATVRGAQAGVQYAEAFEVIRWLDR